MNLDDLDVAMLRRLEESLWRPDVRFSAAKMKELLADDFVEIGASGRIYDRAATLAAPATPFEAELPLADFVVHALTLDIAHVIYSSVVTQAGRVRRARRSSIWSRTRSGWRLRFHQGTPTAE
jgi:hypothetical protein